MYDPQANYRNYTVVDDDAPFLTTRESADLLGVTSTQAVRSKIARGNLPARRVGGSYNPRYSIPRWAVEGLANRRRRLPGEDPSAARREASPQPGRVRVLEDALAAVREAREHEQRAQRMQLEASKELAVANEILNRAVTDVLVPPMLP
jgi:hypothetical protein